MMMPLARWLKRFLIVGLAVVLLAGLVARNPTKVDTTCGPSVTTPPVIKLIDRSASVGDLFASLVDGGPSTLEVIRVMQRTGDMIGLIIDVVTGRTRREPESSFVTGWRNAGKREQQKALASCCVQNSSPVPPPSAPPPDSDDTPYDPKLASIGTTNNNWSREDVVRYAAARYFPADQVNIATAIAMAESSGNPDPPNPPTVNGGTMRGLWQINDGAHPDLVRGRNWRDPAVNAWMAHQVWSKAGKSWRPWTTYTSGAYKKHLRSGAAVPAAGAPAPAPAPDQGAPSAPVAGCTTTGTMTAKIATWNVYVHNSPSNVIRGMRAIAATGADVIATQEVPTHDMRKAISDGLPGFTPAGMDTATPVWVRDEKFEIVGDEGRVLIKRHQPFEGPQQGARFMTVVRLRDKVTKATSTVINTHMLPRVQRNGKLNLSWPKRIGWYRSQYRAVIAEANIAKATGPVAVVGDFNYHGDPDGAFGKAGLPSSGDILGNIASRKGRDIDQVRAAGTVPTSQQVLPTFGSDHHPKVVALQPKQMGAAPVGLKPAQAVGRGGGTSKIRPSGVSSRSAVAAAKAIGPAFGFRTIGTYPQHQPTQALALDFMTSSKAQGDAAAAYARANARALNIQYVIWHTRIWNIERNAEGWRPYTGTSNPHTDHIHISFYPDKVNA